MLSHTERLAAARAAVDYVTGADTTQQARPVPNCPGWTVYNAAAHIGRVSIAWEEMISAPPDDPDSRRRGYERAGRRQPGASMMDLAHWAHSALDRLDDDTDRACYFSMTGGEGTVGLWGWHAASELGVHRLDVEQACGDPHAMTPTQALDAAAYTAQFFLPAMRRVTEIDPGRLTARLVNGETAVGTVSVTHPVESAAAPGVTIEGPPIDVLLALWGRAHEDVDVVEGEESVWDSWRALPGKAFQFGTWD